MDLLERASSLDKLSGVLAATAVGGRVVLVAGEAGIGKSALVRRFTERHSADTRFLLGACDPLLTPRALGPLHDLGRQTGGRLAALLAAASSREQLFTALLDELDQGARSQVVVVEDTHWVDEATLDLLVFLGRRMERTRALLIVTYRDDELAVDHPLHAVVGRLPAEAVLRLRLEPLSEAAVGELARRAGRPAAGLRALTGGNPLLVTELLAAGDAGVPPTIRDLVLARLAGLPADAQEVVRLVAVVPTRTELWVLEQALGPAPSAVEACVAGGLLAVDSETAGFRHELLRQAAEAALSTLGRRALNRRVLRALAGAPEREVDLARLVHHALEDLDRGLAFTRAHDLAGYTQHLLGHRARVRLDLGDWDGAERDAHAALAERVQSGGRAVEALVTLGLLQARGRGTSAAATLQDATERAFPTGDLQWTGQVAAATCASRAARSGPRPPTRPASPAGRSRCSGCSRRA